MHHPSSVTLRDGALVVTPAVPELRPPGMGAALQIRADRAAIVIVDVQHYFLETPPFQAMREVVPPLAALLPLARQAGLRVVHVRTEFPPDLTGLGRHGSRTRQMIGSVADGLIAGTRGVAAPEALREAPEDSVVIKTRFSGFCGTSLDRVLRDHGIDTLLFAGGTTTVCVESTLRDAVFLEYNPLLLTDCVRDVTPELHESAIRRIDMFFGWVCASTSLAQALREHLGADTARRSP